MIRLVTLYRLFIKWLKLSGRFAKTKRAIISAVIKQLGTAAYTAAFVYSIDRGLDLNVVKLFVIGIIVIVIAHKLNR